MLRNLKDNFEKQNFEKVKLKELDELEQFILHKLFLLNKSVDENLKNFNLNPSGIGGENISNSGYLQLFINDIRITRIYSDWVHVPQRFFNLKENFIKITIHSYLHDQFTIKGKPIEHIVKVIDN